MERNLKGFVKFANGGTSVQEWIERYVNPQELRGDGEIMVTYGRGAGKDKIKEWQACFVFTPKQARGANGVMLIDFKGIANFFFIMEDFVNGYLKEDIAFYPVGTPINQITAHSFCCTCMIG